MPISHTDAAKWNTFQWSTKVKHARASGDGAVGVLFVWTDQSANYQIQNAAFVVKPLAGSGASTRFAERVLKDVVGADSPDSIELKKKSAGHTGVLTLIRSLLRKNSIDAVRAQPYLDADTFVLQKMMHGYTEMSEEYRAGPDRLKRMVNDDSLMTNLGKLAAADLILGNGDRIENCNFGNIMFNADGTIAAIDSQALLASFEQIAKASDLQNMDYWGGAFAQQQQENRRTAWVTGLAQGGMAAPTNAQISQFQRKMLQPEANHAAPVLAPVAKLSAVEKGGDGRLFEELIIQFEGRIREAKGTANPIEEPTTDEWMKARRHFMRGFQAGLAKVDTLLGGKAKFQRAVFSSGAWKGLKEEYKKVGYSGVDPNLSWLNLVVRREMYMQLRNGKSMEQAIAAGTALAAKKQGKMLAKQRKG